MAQQPQYEFHYQRVELLKTEELGIGSYGAVCKAMCDDLPCAAKILHRTLFQFTAPGTTSVMRKFEQECRLLSAIKHPHIVQYLGTYHDPESRLPVLLMELMDESLTRFLERSNEPLSYHTELNLCHDIALALSYLHSNGIVHRDLSSNNVLLIAGSRAKVTDFGMVKLYDVNRRTAHLTPLTLCPGTTVYMSPEALRDRPVYTDKLDSFSVGVLCVQIMTRQFPDPGDRVTIIEDSRFPTGTIEVPVPETQRRQSHIDLIDPAHPLLPVALDCLKDRDRERPSCHELCGHISTLKASPKYTESMQPSQVNTKPTQSANRESREREIQQSQQIRDLQQQLHIKDDQLRSLHDQLHIKDDQLQGMERENHQQRQQILELQTLLTAKDEQLTSKDEQLASKDDQLQQKEAAMAGHQQAIRQFRQQLQSSQQVAAQFQQNFLERKKMIQALQRQVLEPQQLRQRGGQRQEEGEASGAAASGGSIKLRWRDGGRAPRKIYGEVSAVDGRVAYFLPGNFHSKIVFTYNSTTYKWSELSECPNSDFSLAMVNNLLTAIGGMTSNDELTNSLLSLTDNKWTKRFPPMPTKRWVTAVECSGRSLVVAGGLGEGNKKLSTEQLTSKDDQLQQKQAAMAAHQQAIWQLRQQLQSSEQVAAEFQQNLLEREKMIQDLQRQVLELQQQLRQRGEQNEQVQVLEKELQEFHDEREEDMRCIESLEAEIEELRRQVDHSQPSSMETTGYLRGVDVIAATSVLITNEAQTFNWAGYGLKLDVPKGALPADLEECRLLVKVGLSGQFTLPQNTSLVSAVYWLDSEPRREFSKHLTLEIQHCVKPTDTSKLSFIQAKCSQTDLPYEFKNVEGGVFSSSSAYGCVQCNHFSLFGAVYNRLVSQVLYSASIYYLRKGVKRIDIHFVITKNLETHATFVQRKYNTKGAILEAEMGVEFESDSISLQGVILEDGWQIISVFHPMITKREVDSFKPGRRIPSCHLKAKWTKPSNPSEFICKLTLKGAKEPCNYFYIDFDCADNLPDPNRRDLDSEPKLPDLMNEVAAKIPSKWRDIGLQLGLSQGVLEGIAIISPRNTNLCYSNVFTLWENQNSTTHPYTWSTIVKVLQAQSVGEEKLATKIKSKLTGLPPQ